MWDVMARARVSPRNWRLGLQDLRAVVEGTGCCVQGLEFGGLGSLAVVARLQFQTSLAPLTLWMSLIIILIMTLDSEILVYQAASKCEKFVFAASKGRRIPFAILSIPKVFQTTGKLSAIIRQIFWSLYGVFRLRWLCKLRGAGRWAYKTGTFSGVTVLRNIVFWVYTGVALIMESIIRRL